MSFQPNNKAMSCQKKIFKSLVQAQQAIVNIFIPLHIILKHKDKLGVISPISHIYLEKVEWEVNSQWSFA